MSIVQEIIDLHGGDLTIVSVSGAGTTVTLWLPTAERITETQAEAQAPDNSNQATPPQGRPA
jgi:signal transduction histidine kinase